MVLYFQQLQDLGKYKVEKTDDYDLARRDGLDISYYEYIKVRGSNPEKNKFQVPSCLYKYSDSELCLYLRDHKKHWGRIAKLLSTDFDVDSEEAMFIFPFQKFNEIDKLIHFVKKKNRKTPAREEEREKSRASMAKINSKSRHISAKNGANLHEKRLDDYLCVEVEK